MTHILTLQLDPTAQAHFDHLRQTHFPPERNHISAHLTLFHTLRESPTLLPLLSHAAETHPRFPLQVTGLRSLGRGVAYTLASPELHALHHILAEAFAADLTPQDRQPFQPHIVVQNKSTPAAARTLLADLERTFSPFEIQAHGLDLWDYLGGPWRHIQTFPLAS